MTASMSLIPVIDLLRGQVVRAVRGDRQAYQPINSALCASADPVTVARVLCDHCAARQLYVADLDALMGGTAQVAVLQALLAAMPAVELWLDAGFADAAQARALLGQLGESARHVVPVFGSESLRSRAALAGCFARSGSTGATEAIDTTAIDTTAVDTTDGVDAPMARAALSLDRRDGQRLDAAGCWDAPALWPQRVIVMTLERVGSGCGPDLETMAEVRRKAPHAMLIGAGGVRSEADLVQARAAGADAWLVASALHDMQLPRTAG